MVELFLKHTLTVYMRICKVCVCRCQYYYSCLCILGEMYGRGGSGGGGSGAPGSLGGGTGVGGGVGGGGKPAQDYAAYQQYPPQYQQQDQVRRSLYY